MKVWAPPSSYAAKGGRGGAGEHLWPVLSGEIGALSSLAELVEWREAFVVHRQRDTPLPFVEAVWEALDARNEELRLEARARAVSRGFDNRFADRMADDRA